MRGCPTAAGLLQLLQQMRHFVASVTPPLQCTLRSGLASPAERTALRESPKRGGSSCASPSGCFLPACLHCRCRPMRRKPTPTERPSRADATVDAAAVDDPAVELHPADTSDIVVTATRRNEALSDVPLAVSAVTAETLAEFGRQRHSPAPARCRPSLLVSSTSSEAGAGVARIRGVGTVGDNPGLESSVAVFIDGVYRSRTGVGLTELGAHRPGRGAARTAGHAVRPQRLGRPDLDHHRQAALRDRSRRRARRIGNYDLRRFEAGVTGADQRDHRLRASTAST